MRVQEPEEERGKMLVMGEPLFLDAATVLTILVSETDKLRDHLRGLVRGYLDDGVRLQGVGISTYVIASVGNSWRVI